jgi:hypothetical protein
VLDAVLDKIQLTPTPPLAIEKPSPTQEDAVQSIFDVNTILIHRLARSCRQKQSSGQMQIAIAVRFLESLPLALASPFSKVLCEFESDLSRSFDAKLANYLDKLTVVSVDGGESPLSEYLRVRALHYLLFRVMPEKSLKDLYEAIVGAGVPYIHPRGRHSLTLAPICVGLRRNQCA